MVGFQTKMAYPEQKRVFSMIPGLENAEFLKLGSIHRNLFINSPKRLNKDLSSKNDPWLLFAGGERNLPRARWICRADLLICSRLAKKGWHAR
jgi:folate-dependent tRNA-U54 methylase TrmFO/GidA